MKIITTLILFGIFLMASLSFYHYGRSVWVPLKNKYFGMQTVKSVSSKIGSKTRNKLTKLFSSQGQIYPPQSITFLAIKSTSTLEIWDTSPKNGKNIFIKSYRIHALSGKSGPKLQEGDRQVPEGIYKISGLNPNSSYHLSMKINYPNQFDLKYARIENRLNPGSNIFIHGKALSVGCLAMGDETVELLFILAADIGYHNVKIIIAPSDPRVKPLNASLQKNWVKILYANITAEFADYMR